MGMDIENLNDFMMDMLKELGNIGAGSAATSLALAIFTFFTSSDAFIFDSSPKLVLVGPGQSVVMLILSFFSSRANASDRLSTNDLVAK